jgi:hypothetical protein
LAISIYGNIFGQGNIKDAFTEFRTAHVCNEFCHFFGLTMDIPSPEIPPAELEPEPGRANVD